MADEIVPVEYRSIPGFPGYRIGDDGTLWSEWGTASLGKGHGTKTIRRSGEWKRIGTCKSHGYYQASLRREGGGFSLIRLHVLLMRVFCGERPDGMHIRHLNGDPSDNRLVNLVYGTASENRADSRRHGTEVVGEKHGNAKLKDEDVRTVRKLLSEGRTHQNIADIYGVSCTLITRISLGQARRFVA